MAVTSAAVLAIAPELSVVSAGMWTVLLAAAVEQVGVDAWGSQARADLAVTYLAAHLATDGIGAAGSYANTADDTRDPLAATRYGREFIRLRNSLVVARAGVVA